VATLARDFGSSAPDRPALLACPECDLLQRDPADAAWGSVACCRCGATLYRRVPRAPDATLALTVAAAILFAIANLYPVMSLDMQGRHNEATFIGMAIALHEAGMTSVAILVTATVIVIPELDILSKLWLLMRMGLGGATVVLLRYFESRDSAEIGALLWMLTPLRLGFVPRGMATAARVHCAVRPWAMVEVLMLAALVSIGRLGHLADLELGAGFWAMGAVMFLFAVIDTIFDEHALWGRAAEIRGARRP